MGTDMPLWTCGKDCNCIKRFGINTPLTVIIKLKTITDTKYRPLFVYTYTYSCIS